MLQKPNRSIRIIRPIFILLSLIPWLIFLYNYFKIPESGLLSLEGRFGNKQLTASNPNDLFLLKGKIISGEFTSPFPNLGIVAVRFDTFNRINDDWLTFRIKEITASDWYYVASYKTDQFQPNQLFPFGFPLINESSQKTYLFEIESQRGQPENYVAVDTTYPIFVSRHIFTREEIKANIKKFLFVVANKPVNILFQKNASFDQSSTVQLGNFLIITKIINLFGDEIFRFYTFVYLFPLIYYLLILKFHFKPFTSILIFLSIFIADVLFFNRNSDYLLLSFVIIGLLSQIHHPITQKLFLLLFLILLFSASILIIFKLDIIAERIIVWQYLLLLIYAIYQILPQRTTKFIKKL